jgi:hypothetical protein
MSHRIQIDDNLYNDIAEYCKINNETVSGFCQRILKEQLLIEKFGDTPFTITSNIITPKKVVENYIAPISEKETVNVDNGHKEIETKIKEKTEEKIETIIKQEIKPKRRRL